MRFPNLNNSKTRLLRNTKLEECDFKTILKEKYKSGYLNITIVLLNPKLWSHGTFDLEFQFSYFRDKEPKSLIGKGWKSNGWPCSFHVYFIRCGHISWLSCLHWASIPAGPPGLNPSSVSSQLSALGQVVLAWEPQCLHPHNNLKRPGEAYSRWHMGNF